MAKDKFEPREEDIGATDYRAYFDSSVLRVWHLDGKERVFRIGQVRRLTAEIGQGGKREVKRQPLLHLCTPKGEPISLPLALNKTNAKTIAGLYGNDPRKWAGQLIALYPTTTEVGGRTEDCIRVRNEDPSKRRPRGKTQAEQTVPPVTIRDDGPPYREPGDDTAEDEEPPPGALETDHANGAAE